MQYIILSSKSTSQLSQEVNKYISNGWTPQGGIAVECEVISGMIAYFQAMIKNK